VVALLITADVGYKRPLMSAIHTTDRRCQLSAFGAASAVVVLLSVMSMHLTR
jgi:hypothetical protein